MNEKAEKVSESRIELGFSLIEVLVVILLTVIILIGLYDLMETNQKIYNAQQDVTTMNLRTRTAVLQMVTAIRTAGSNNLNAFNLSGNPIIAIAESDRIRVVEDLPMDTGDGVDPPGPPDGDTFDRNDLPSGSGDGDFADNDEDENGDGFINDPNEDVTFTLNGTDLTRTQYLDDFYCPSNCPGSSSDILTNDIESLTFEYYSDTATLIPLPITGADLYTVKLVRVTVDAKTHSVDRLTGRPHKLELKSDIFLRNQ